MQNLTMFIVPNVLAQMVRIHHFDLVMLIIYQWLCLRCDQVRFGKLQCVQFSIILLKCIKYIYIFNLWIFEVNASIFYWYFVLSIFFTGRGCEKCIRKLHVLLIKSSITAVLILLDFQTFDNTTFFLSVCNYRGE